jgi:hypothetical protein
MGNGEAPEMDVNEVLAAVHNEYGGVLAQQTQRIAMLQVQLAQRDRQLLEEKRTVQRLSGELMDLEKPGVTVHAVTDPELLGQPG